MHDLLTLIHFLLRALLDLHPRLPCLHMPLNVVPAQVCGLRPGEFVHTCGDAHVYSNHVEPLKQQLLNPPRHLPRLLLNPAKTSIDAFVAEDFELVGYSPHKTIKMQMAV